MFFDCVVISDLYLFQETVVLNPCFTFSKNLMLSFIDKVTTVWDMKFSASNHEISSVMLFWCSIKTQSFVHNKSSSTSQFIKGKSRDLQKLLSYLSGIVTSTFKDGTGGCADWSAFPGFPGCGGRSGVSPIIFVLYSNGLPSDALSLTSASTILSL